MAYNGMHNRETWLVNAWMGDYLVELARERIQAGGEGISAVEIQSLIEDEINQKLANAGLLVDLLNTSMHRVNWVELADFVNSQARLEAAV